MSEPRCTECGSSMRMLYGGAENYLAGYECVRNPNHSGTTWHQDNTENAQTPTNTLQFNPELMAAATLILCFGSDESVISKRVRAGAQEYLAGALRTAYAAGRAFQKSSPSTYSEENMRDDVAEMLCREDRQNVQLDTEFIAHLHDVSHKPDEIGTRGIGGMMTEERLMNKGTT